MDVELEFFGPLLESLLVEDDLIPVDEMLFDLVGDDSLDWVDLVTVTDLLDKFGDLSIGVSWSDDSQGSLCGLVGGQNHISLLSGNRLLGVALDYKTVSHEAWIAVNMGPQLDLDQISLLNGSGILGLWRIVGAYFVEGNTSGEGQTLKHLFLVKDLAQFLVNLVVSESTQIDDLGTHGCLLDQLGQDV